MGQRKMKGLVAGAATLIATVLMLALGSAASMAADLGKSVRIADDYLETTLSKSIGSSAAGERARAAMAPPNLRRNSTAAASQAS